ncbi:MAG: ABC transporter permease subunit [Candidatus Lokiarchaeota archaeon]|nr:ABC transporter permease subunit [Candidatus Lokiarchaeota archaeon]
MDHKIIKSEIGEETTDNIDMKDEKSGLMMNLTTPSVILFKKTLFKDMFKFPKLLVSIILMVLGPLMAILMIPPGFELYYTSLNDYLGLTYSFYTYSIMFPIILTVVGAPLIAEELKSGTMLTLISKPISRGEILVTKYLALTCFGFLINIASLSLITLIAPLKYAFEGVAEFFVINLLFSLIVQLFFQSIAFGFSCLFKKTRNAILLPLLIVIVTFFVLMTFRPMFMYMYIGDSEVPIYVQFQLFHFDLAYHLFNAYIGILNIISGGVSESMMYFLYMFGLYTQEFDEYTWEISFTRNDYYSPLGSFIFLLSIAIGLLLLGYFLFKKRDISR